MHNGAVKRTGAVVSLLLSCALLAGCSGDPEEPASADPTGSATPSESTTPTPEAPPSLEVPEGVALTAEGSALALGDQAVVAYQPRQEAVGVLEVTVARIERTTFRRSFAGWQLGAGSERTGVSS